MSGFDYKVTVDVPQADFKNILLWLHDHGHVLHETMKFGASSHKQGNGFVTQNVRFKDPNQAMMFKLAWGGK
jgi:hypothetical protein